MVGGVWGVGRRLLECGRHIVNFENDLGKKKNHRTSLKEPKVKEPKVKVML